MKKIYLFILFSFLQSTILFSQNTSSPTNWKFAVQMWTFNKSTFIEGLDKAETCGFKYIEAYPGQTLGGNFKGEIGIAMNEDERNKLKQLLQEKGITMIAFGVVGSDNANTNEKWKQYFDFAKDMGVEEITVMPSFAQLDYINKLAGEYHIKAAIHDEPGKNTYDHPDSVERAINGRKNLGACVDVGNWVRNGVNIVDALQKNLKGRVFSVHLKDVKEAGVTDAPDVVLGHGACDIPAVLKELKNQNFNGFISLEHEFPSEANLNDVKADVQYFHQQINML